MRSIILVVASISFLDAAQAQEPKPPETVTLTLNQQDVGIIGAALGAMPFRDANPLLQKLDAQISAQTKATADKSADKSKKPASK